MNILKISVIIILFSTLFVYKVQADDSKMSKIERVKKISKESLISTFKHSFYKIAKSPKNVKPDFSIDLYDDYYYLDKKYEVNFLRIQIFFECKYLKDYNIPIYPACYYFLEHGETMSLEELILLYRVVGKVRQKLLKKNKNEEAYRFNKLENIDLNLKDIMSPKLSK